MVMDSDLEAEMLAFSCDILALVGFICGVSVSRKMVGELVKKSESYFQI